MKVSRGSLSVDIDESELQLMTKVNFQLIFGCEWSEDYANERRRR